MTQEEFKDLLDKYARGACTPDEIRIVDEWYHNIKMEDIGAPVPSTESIESVLWAKIKPVTPMRAARPRLLRIAASIAALAIASYFLITYLTPKEVSPASDAKVFPDALRGTDDVYIFNSEKVSQRLTLEDGTTIVLEPGSAVAYARRFGATRREVNLSGEAFFNVRKDPARPFYVYSKEIVTRVLGTSFTVKAYDGEKKIVVSVKTGKVSVSRNPQESHAARVKMPDVLLTPNQQVIYDRERDTAYKQITDSPSVLEEKSTFFKMSFDGKPVTEIFQALEDNYGIDIRYDSSMLKDCILTTTMAQEGFYERIEIICKAINAEYSTEEAVVTIRSNGCRNAK